MTDSVRLRPVLARAKNRSEDRRCEKNKEKMQMKKFLVILGLIGIVGLICSASFAQQVILTNDDNPSGNSATAFTVSGTNLSLYKKLTTGGDGLGGGFFAAMGTAIASNAKCVWVANTASDTISSFEAPSYSETGSVGTPGMFSANGDGGSITVHPTGKLVVSGNSGSENISTWLVGSNCKLSHLADYTPSQGSDLYSPILYTPNGAYLIVPASDLESAELFKQNTNGSLTDVGFVSFIDDVSSCSSFGCFPTGMDITADSKVVLFGNASLGGPSALSASISGSGLSSPAFWSLTNSAGAINVNIPHFTKTARSGSGDLIFGASGFSSDGPSGILCANFTESPLNISVVNSVTVPNEDNFQGSVQTFGNNGFAAEYPNAIESFTIGSGCSVTLVKSTSDPNGAGLLSISAYPANQ
jgi:hypothetical protein